MSGSAGNPQAYALIIPSAPAVFVGKAAYTVDASGTLTCSHRGRVKLGAPRRTDYEGVLLGAFGTHYVFDLENPEPAIPRHPCPPQELAYVGVFVALLSDLFRSPAARLVAGTAAVLPTAKRTAELSVNLEVILAPEPDGHPALFSLDLDLHLGGDLLASSYLSGRHLPPDVRRWVAARELDLQDRNFDEVRRQVDAELEALFEILNGYIYPEDVSARPVLWSSDD